MLSASHQKSLTPRHSQFPARSPTHHHSLPYLQSGKAARRSDFRGSLNVQIPAADPAVGRVKPRRPLLPGVDIMWIYLRIVFQVAQGFLAILSPLGRDTHSDSWVYVLDDLCMMEAKAGQKYVEGELSSTGGVENCTPS